LKVVRDFRTAGTAKRGGASLIATVGLLLMLAFPSLAGAVTFSSAPTLTAELGAAAVGVADLNADGNSDFAVPNALGTVSVFLGNGDGTFTSKGSSTAAAGARGVAIRDFNGDGKLDLAVVNGTANNVSILLGDGTGKFTAATPPTVASGSAPRGIGSGDFNGDGKFDLVTVNNGTTNNVQVLLGNGDGTFATAVASNSGGGNCRNVVVEDFNGDGKLDLAITNNSTENVSILLGKGNGTFEAPNPPFSTSKAGPFALVPGDFTGDGKLDLAVANQSSSSISVLPGTGTGTFGSAVTTEDETGKSPAGIGKGDFNSDGKLDVVVSNSSEERLAVFLGDGTGKFSGPTKLATGETPAGIAVGHFNAGAKDDIAVANGNSGTVSVFLGVAEPTLSTAASASVAIGASISDQATLAGGENPTGSIVFKAYGPGDLTCSNAPAFTSSSVSVSGNGSYPSPNFTPTEPGTYRWIASYSGDTENTAAAGACNDSGETSIVNFATPTLGTQATASVAFGGTIADEATISGYNPTGSIVFKAYGPNDATCANAPAFTSSAVTVSGNNTYSTAGFTPSTAGTYRWVASYSGDANNEAVAGACNDANETSVVSKQVPTLATEALSNEEIGQPIGDEATISGGSNPTGSIVFKAYGPDDATCANAPAFTSSAVTVSGNGDYNSPTFTPGALGTYRWVASYSGDANNEAVAGACNDANEETVVGKSTPALSTQATAAASVGDTIADEATLGGYNPTGSIVFEAYGPDDATCANTPAFVSSAVTVSGTGPYSTPGFTATEPGTYRWVASYSGDANNEAVSGACNDSGEETVVSSLPTPTITTEATASAAFGQSIMDKATLASGDNPTGSIVFKAYGPNNATCSGSPAFTSSAVTVSGNDVYESPTFTPTTAGTYRWVATYSGDSNNNTSSGACNDANETSVVSKTVPSLSTSATANAFVGGTIADEATLSGGSSPTGSIVFKAYGPNDATCANAPAFTSSAVTVSGNNTYSTAGFTPSTAGTYRWVASYSGDANNEAVAGACNDANETSVVAKVTPGMSTEATVSAAFGGSIKDKATITGGQSPTGSIVFKAYGPNDATCANAPAFTSSAVPVSGNNTYESPTFSPASAGTYRWVASYSGDANNEAVAGACNDANETSTIAKATPAMSTQATTTANLLQPIKDKATIVGGSNPTGSIVFKAYGPDDATCANAPAFTSSAVTVSGAGSYESPEYTPTEKGTYRWIAAYSGDADNASITGNCNDANETSEVGKATPTLATEAVANVTFGESIHDKATIAGGNSPTGTITFKVYAYPNVICAGEPNFTFQVAVNGNGTYTSPSVTPETIKAWRWIASYSGDADNAAVTGHCGDAGETSTVAAGTVTLKTEADASATLGSSIRDKATIGGFVPSGTLTFKLYGPDNADCSGTPVFSSKVPVGKTGTFNSAAYTPTAVGTYRWIASYGEDENNKDVTGACNDAGETTVVKAETPPPPPPSNAIKVLKVTSNKSNGTAKIKIDVPGAGKVVMTGSGIKKVTKSMGAAGKPQLQVKPTGSLLNKLKKQGKVSVTVKVQFTPTGGSTGKKNVKVKLYLKK
jgi:FG-GAP-like repeat